MEVSAEKNVLENRSPYLDDCYEEFSDSIHLSKYSTYGNLYEVPVLTTLYKIWQANKTNVAFCEYLNCVADCAYGVDLGGCPSPSGGVGANISVYDGPCDVPGLCPCDKYKKCPDGYTCIAGSCLPE